MTNVFIGTTAAAGHVRPLLPIARELVESGHQVLWYTGAEFRSQVEAVGARYAPMVQGVAWDGDQLAGMDTTSRPAPGPRRLVWDVRNAFIAPIPQWVADVRLHAEGFAPDVFLCDQGFVPGVLAGQLRDVPTVVITVSPLMAGSVDTPPAGLGMLPMGGAVGRLRNRLLNAVVHRMFREVQRDGDVILADLGLPPRNDFILDWTMHSADRFLLPTVPGFEYPRSDLPSTVEFIGAILPKGVDRWTPPSWWSDVAAARAAGRPVVVITQGTLAIDPAKLLLPGIQALRDADALVIGTTGGPDPESVLPAADRPANLRLERFIPFTELLPLTDLMVTNGGYGGTQLALANGVPVVVAGKTEDKMEVSARVRWSGAGIALDTDTPTDRQIRTAARKVLADSLYRETAQRLQREYATYDGVSRAVDAVLETVHARSRLAT